MGEDLGLANIHPDGTEPLDQWPTMSLPQVRPISEREHEEIRLFRALTRRARGAVGFSMLKKAALASGGLTDDGLATTGDFGAVDVAPLIASLAAPRSSLRLCMPEELLRTPRERQRSADGPRPAKRMRAASDVAALADRLVASEEKEGEARQAGPDDDEPEVEEEVEEDEPDDYMRDYYDEDNDALEGDDNEPVF